MSVDEDPRQHTLVRPPLKKSPILTNIGLNVELWVYYLPYRRGIINAMNVYK